MKQTKTFVSLLASKTLLLLCLPDLGFHSEILRAVLGPYHFLIAKNTSRKSQRMKSLPMLLLCCVLVFTAIVTVIWQSYLKTLLLGRSKAIKGTQKEAVIYSLHLPPPQPTHLVGKQVAMAWRWYPPSLPPPTHTQWPLTQDKPFVYPIKASECLDPCFWRTGEHNFWAQAGLQTHYPGQEGVVLGAWSSQALSTEKCASPGAACLSLYRYWETRLLMLWELWPLPLAAGRQ